MMENIISNGNRVREKSSKSANIRIDQKTYVNVKKYFNEPERVITKRIEKLDREWDIERVLSLNLTVIGLTGFALSTRDRKWLALPTVIMSFFAQQAVQGWSPPLPILRFLRFRTRDEIDQEKFALKALRGDFDGIGSAEEAFMAVKK